ncbi:hypothetical protein DEO72_LG2g4200 [Vigna unguiculata]|uniref:Uncharacterized protein n=1 Tax=Vigna unguiculata TaxID=3917 RepID=A0A4D6L5P4_VIGUN|nr:hypothetical protein DEO72_LG2g4200 [Vigna unguiculata]
MREEVCIWYAAWRRLASRQAMMSIVREPCTEWRLAARCAPPGDDEKTVALKGAGAWRFMDGVTCDDMRGEVHIKLLSRGDTSGEVRRAGLRAGRFVEAGPRAGSSPFLFVCGDDRVIRYTGADVDTGGAEDAQVAE